MKICRSPEYGVDDFAIDPEPYDEKSFEYIIVYKSDEEIRFSNEGVDL